MDHPKKQAEKKHAAKDEDGPDQFIVTALTSEAGGQKEKNMPTML